MRRVWTITTPGYRPFTMAMPEPVTPEEALALARVYWPLAQVT